jgi:predicted RNase H-like nuclease (RuvC/YqgF family)
MVKQGLTIEQFGATPYTKEPEVVEKEVEVIKEVPVERIVEKEVIKTVEVEKEVYISDDAEVNKLTDRITQIESELDEARRDSRQKLDEKLSNIGNLNDIIDKLRQELDEVRQELDEVRQELDEEKKKEKKETNDIYGDDKKGFFGSNLSDLWKKK